MTETSNIPELDFSVCLGGEGGTWILFIYNSFRSVSQIGGLGGLQCHESSLCYQSRSPVAAGMSDGFMQTPLPCGWLCHESVRSKSQKCSVEFTGSSLSWQQFSSFCMTWQPMSVAFRQFQRLCTSCKTLGGDFVVLGWCTWWRELRLASYVFVLKLPEQPHEKYVK